MSTLLVEIGCEELPAREAFALAQALALAIETRLQAAGLGGRAKALGTPRRLAALVHDVRERQGDRQLEVRGPSLAAAFAADGTPTRAVVGFAQAQGVAVPDLVRRETTKGAYVYAMVEERGRLLEDIALEIIPAALAELRPSRTMQWGDVVRFLRPVRWLVGLCDERVVPFGFGHLTADRVTYGKRGSGGPLVIARAQEYEAVMTQGGVMAEREGRQAIIRERGNALAAAVGASVEWQEALLDEVTDLTEWPEPFIGTFPESYLRLPEAVLVTAMTHHQRYFPLRRDGRLLPSFLAVRNAGAESIVRSGNEKVLRARLADAAFFYDDDIRRPLSARRSELRQMTYQEKLGTLYERTERLSELAFGIGREAFGAKVAAAARQAGEISKCDLVTWMVREFPELEGVMGGVYAEVEGLSAPVSAAIAQHYLPRGSGDTLPSSDAARALALADKLDHLSGGFLAGLAPTGSQDPFALRRSAIGALRLLEEMPLSMPDLVRASLSLYPMAGAHDHEASVMAFLQARLEAMMLDRGLAADVVQAALALPLVRVDHAFARAQALHDALGSPAFMDLLTAFRRSRNLAEPGLVPDETELEEAERLLLQAVRRVGAAVQRAADEGDYRSVFDLAAGLREPLDRFFADVMVMAEEEALRTRRRALLAEANRVLAVGADLARLSFVSGQK